MKAFFDAKGKFVLLFIIAIFIGCIGIIRELGRPEYHKSIMAEEMIYITQEEGNDSGYIVEKQIFFDKDCGYSAQFTTPEISLAKGKYLITVNYKTENETGGGAKQCLCLLSCRTLSRNLSRQSSIKFV